MTKLEQLKSDMGYNPKPVHPMCINCTSYRSDMVTEKHAFGEWIGEKNMRCTLGQFATKKTATCSKHEFQTDKS